MPEDVIKAKIVFDTSGIEGAARAASTRAGGPTAQRQGRNGVGADVKGAAGKIPELGSLLSATGPLMALAAGMGVAISIWKNIYGSIKKMNKTLEEAAPDFKASRDIQKKIFNLALRPMTSVMTVLMKPYLLLQMLALKKALSKAKPVLAGLKAGELTPEEAVSQMQPIFEDAMTEIGWISMKMEETLRPIMASMAGFQQGLDIIFANWTGGLSTWATNFLKALRTNTVDIPPGLAETISKAILEKKIDLEQIPKNIRIPYEAHILKNVDDLDPFSTQVKDEVLEHITSGSGELEAVMGQLALSIAYHAMRGFISADPFEHIWSTLKKAGEQPHGQVLGWITGLFSDFISRPGQPVASFSPDDTIIGVKNPSALFGGNGRGTNVTVNINAIDGSSISPSVLSRISDAVQEGVTRNMAGISSQSWGY